MKNIIIALLLLMVFAANAQPYTLSPGEYTTTRYTSNDMSFLATVIDTVTVDDTLFIDGDTLLNVEDTVIFDFPTVIGNSVSGMITFESDSIESDRETDGDVGFALYQSACADCPYYAITSADGTHTTPPDDSNKFFQLRGFRLRLVYWAISGASWIEANIALKPSSLSNNSSN